MSTIVRIYSNNKRVATGKPWKNQFLQVYPVVKAFPSEEDWKASYEIRTVKVTKAAKDDSDSWSDSLCTEDFDSLDWQPVEIPAKHKVSLGATMEYLESLPAPTAKKGASPKRKVKASWTYDKDVYTLELPEGTYYLGDPTHVISNEMLVQILGKNIYKPGLYQNDTSFLLLGSPWKRGEIKGTDGKTYFLDCYIFCICSMDLINKKSQCLKYGAIKTFKEPVSCKFKNGVFLFESGDKSFFVDT